MKTGNKYDMIVKMYVGNDPLRDKLMQVNLNKLDEMLEATDAHILIRMPSKYAGLEYKEQDKYPTVISVIPTEFKGGEFKIKVDKLAELLTTGKFQYEQDHESCDTCDGDGTIECRCCGNESDCEDCDGTGKCEVEKPYAELKYRGEDVFLQGNMFNPKYIYTLYITCVLLGLDEITMRLKDDSKSKGVVFELNDVLVLIMPKRQED